MNQDFTTDIVIGLEIHAQLNTKTKLFCSCPTNGTEAPNTRTCEVCLGHPGSKPVFNKKVVEYAIRLCLALESDIAPELIFSRKSYFYPDMAKNYQITQYEIPVGSNGKVKINDEKEVNIVRAHIEEDPAALTHPAGMQNSSYVMVDYNRSGNPLIEIVTQPEMYSAAEAREFMKKLITILEYLEIFDVNKGIIKADANVSIKESGYIRAEIKNVTGFKEIERALNYEIDRQKRAVKEGEQLKQETRAWDSDRGITFSLRTKETEEDYGYIIDPDLTKTEITEGWINKIKESMPELAHQKVSKFIEKHKISREDAEVLAQEKFLAELFESVAKEVDARLAAKWLRRELIKVANYHKKNLRDLEIEEAQIVKLLSLVEHKKITENVAQKILEKLSEKCFDVEQYVKDEGLEAVSDSGELEKFCDEAISECQSAVEDYKNGTEKAINAVVGKVMQKTRGKADPAVVKELILKKI